ncbi:uncharacterized protein LOC144660227 [Oculina patagonica]
MKRVSIILVIFLVLDCCWARKLEDADRPVLERNNANKFLSHEKRWASCEYAKYQYETDKEFWGWIGGSLTEECCNEGCSVEEYDETTDQGSEKETFVTWCC